MKLAWWTKNTQEVERKSKDQSIATVIPAACQKRQETGKITAYCLLLAILDGSGGSRICILHSLRLSPGISLLTHKSVAIFAEVESEVIESHRPDCAMKDWPTDLNLPPNFHLCQRNTQECHQPFWDFSPALNLTVKCDFHGFWRIAFLHWRWQPHDNQTVSTCGRFIQSSDSTTATVWAHR